MLMMSGDGGAMASRELLAGDPHRPQYHFLPPSNWLNDPNGLIQWHGQYHMFYQHNPHAPVMHPMSWGHAVSHDLVHWSDMPVALAPTPGAVDESGVWSGCAVDADGIATVVYTGVRKREDGSWGQLPCVATSNDGDLRTWCKHSANPVIASPPGDIDVLGFRDHSVWREDQTWYQVIGSGIRGVGGTVLLYRSPDLVDWEYVGPMCIGNAEDTGTMWECPDVFQLDQQRVLVVSPIPLRKALYFIGESSGHRFKPVHQGVVDESDCFYAPQSFTDDQGRRIMFGWLREQRDEAAQLAAGWAGVMSLPRLLLPRSDGCLGMEPAPEVAVLRRSHTAVRDTRLESDRLIDVRGMALEIEAEIGLGQASEVGITLRSSPDGAEQTVIVFDIASGTLAIDKRRSSLDLLSRRDRRATRLELAEHEHLRLRVFLDHSVVEVFANGRTCLTSRVYPTRTDSLGVSVFSAGGAAHLFGLDVWEMDAVWPTKP